MTTVEEVEARKLQIKMEKEQAQAAAQARKQKMLLLEEQRKRNEPLTDMEQEDVNATSLSCVSFRRSRLHRTFAAGKAEDYGRG